MPHNPPESPAAVATTVATELGGLPPASIASRGNRRRAGSLHSSGGACMGALRPAASHRKGTRAEAQNFSASRQRAKEDRMKRTKGEAQRTACAGAPGARPCCSHSATRTRGSAPTWRSVRRCACRGISPSTSRSAQSLALVCGGVMPSGMLRHPLLLPQDFFESRLGRPPARLTCQTS